MLHNQAIDQVKVQWKHFGLDEATWEMEDQMWALFPSLFSGWVDVFGLYLYMHICIVYTEMICVVKIQ